MTGQEDHVTLKSIRDGNLLRNYEKETELMDVVIEVKGY